uniref:Uncharacterized protein n=1 Tax=Trypanosoma congolense (strain IL3000) TaxID=1068625 RepID=G0UNN4_TRYCI|nr:hypothetical protein, unlikely [Trypanosoma congolense IL3000]
MDKSKVRGERTTITTIPARLNVHNFLTNQDDDNSRLLSPHSPQKLHYHMYCPPFLNSGECLTGWQAAQSIVSTTVIDTRKAKKKKKKKPGTEGKESKGCHEKKKHGYIQRRTTTIEG